MKITVFLPFIYLFFCFDSWVLAQEKQVEDYMQEIQTQREAKDRKFKTNEDASPLTAEHRETFQALSYFPIQMDYRVEARLEKTPNTKPFFMPTTTGRKARYRLYGKLNFEIKGESFQLEVYQNLDLLKNPLYKDYLFVPFKDQTNGEVTYGGGRYLELSKSQSKTVILDFNQAYNPYCAYNRQYSCPIPPAQNHLETRIEAGEKKYLKK